MNRSAGPSSVINRSDASYWAIYYCSETLMVIIMQLDVERCRCPLPVRLTSRNATLRPPDRSFRLRRSAILCYYCPPAFSRLIVPEGRRFRCSQERRFPPLEPPCPGFVTYPSKSHPRSQIEAKLFTSPAYPEHVPLHLSSSTCSERP